LESGAQNAPKKSFKKRNFDLNQFELNPTDDPSSFSESEITESWSENLSIEEEYQSLVNKFEKINLPDSPRWEDDSESLYSWFNPNDYDHDEWLKKEVPKNLPRKLVQEIEEDRLPSEKRRSENLKKQRCPHGYSFYHAEAFCYSCDLETILLDQEFLENRGQQSSPELRTEPVEDSCAHDIPINGNFWCVDCLGPVEEGFYSSEEGSDSEYRVWNAQERNLQEAQENIERLLLKEERKKDAERNGKRKKCQHSVRNHEGCWKCDLDNDILRDNITRQQRSQNKRPRKRTRKSKSTQNVPRNHDPIAATEDWLEEIFGSLQTPLNWPSLDLQESAQKLPAERNIDQEKRDYNEFTKIGRSQPRPREELHENYDWHLKLQEEHCGRTIVNKPSRL
jgi:hypothetical protein